MTQRVTCTCGWSGSGWDRARQHVLDSEVVVHQMTHRVETYKPRPRPAGEHEELIRQSIRGASKSPDVAHPRHPSGTE